MVEYKAFYAKRLIDMASLIIFLDFWRRAECRVQVVLAILPFSPG